MQLERQARPGDPAGTVALTATILARPAAGEFSGRQRDALRDLFAEPDPQLLRDLTTLLLAELPAPEAE